MKTITIALTAEEQDALEHYAELLHCGESEAMKKAFLVQYENMKDLMDVSCHCTIHPKD